MKSVEERKQVIVIHSGGMDSTTLLYHHLRHGDTVKALSIDYGQRHRKELEMADQICLRAGIERVELDLRNLRPLLCGSSQTDDSIEVPEGHYAAENMKLTVVPNRNMLMLSLAAAWAISLKYDGVSYGAHAGDHAIYPDCREEFTVALEEAIRLADWHEVSLYRPFISKTKAEICALGAELGVPFNLTWSCYRGAKKHCGRCGTCMERLESFHAAGIEDPVEYEDREYWKTVGEPET